MKTTDSPEATAVTERTREFVDTRVREVEREYRSANRVPYAEIRDLHEEAREAGVFGPGIPEEYGGLGLSFRDQVPVIEAAGRSRLGTSAIHAPPWPDEANVYFLQVAGTEAQKEKWLAPLCRGDIRSAVAMTEPTAGAGSDPTMIRTSADRDGDEWVINGHKWWVTQGGDADVILVFAKSDSDAGPYEGTTCFIVPADADGVTVQRDIAHMSDHVAGEPVHSEITFDDVRVPDANVLGETHDGFAFFQQGVDHSRVWLGVHKIGMADRALDVAKAYANEREAFGERLVDKQAFRHDIAEAETDLYTLRLMARDVAQKITDGRDCRTEVAMFKYYCANTVQDVIDDAVQHCGANGIGKDLPLSNFYTNVRAYRIYDGPDAVHKKIIARDALDDERIDENEVEHISRFGHPNTWPGE